MARMSALLAGLPVVGARGDHQPAVRLRASTRWSLRRPRDRGRRRLGDGRGRRRVDDPCALRPAQAGPGVPGRKRGAVQHHARLADGQPARCRTCGPRASAPAPRHWPRSSGWTREDADAFAVRSHQRAAAAWAAGAYDDAVVHVAGTTLTRDEGIRDGVTPTRWQGFGRSSGPTAQVTAGNSSQLSDGAAALLLADEDGLRELGTEPLARVTATGVHAVEPHRFGIGPGRGRQPRAGQGRPEPRRRRGDGAQRGLRRPGARVHGPVARPRPRRGQPARRGDRHRPPARLLGCPARRAPSPTSSRPPARASGVATLCIGVGQGLAVTLER